MDARPFSILFIDDEPALRDIFLHLAKRSQGVTMQAAASASDALRLLQETCFDAIVLDYDMPEINGIQLLKILRSRGDTTPVIMFTGEGRENTAIEALNNGANFYLKKSDDSIAQFREILSIVKIAVERSYLGTPVGTSQRIIEDMINLTTDPAFAIDSKGVVIAWNDPMVHLTDIPTCDIIGKGDLVYAEPFFGTKRKMLLDLVFEPDEEIRRQMYMLVSRMPKGPVIAVTRGKKKDGVERTIWIKATPLFDAQGMFIAAAGIIRDVTTTFSDVMIWGDTHGDPPDAAAADKLQVTGTRIFNRILGKAMAEYRAGVILMARDQKYAEAIAAFDRALEIDENFAQAWNERGLCYREQNDYANALKSCLRAVELDPENPELLYMLGETFQRLGTMNMSNKYFGSAIQVFKMVIYHKPNCMDAWNNLGICYREMGKEEVAKFHFDRARDIGLWKKDTPIVPRRNDYI